jgi:hypothetical protein
VNLPGATYQADEDECGPVEVLKQLCYPRPSSFSHLQRSGGHSPEEGFARAIAVATSAPLASKVIPCAV